MNILQLTSGTGVNGAIRHCYDLTCELALRGHRVVLGHKAGAWIASQPVPPGVELLEVTLKRRPAEIRRVAALLREREIEVMHTHTSSAHATGAILSFFYKIPRVATSHGTFFQPHWRLCDRVIAPSRATARFQRWVNLVPRKRIEVIPNFINPRRLAPARTRGETREFLGIDGNRFVILTVGEVFHRKNQELLVKALPALIAGATAPPLVLLVGKEDPAYRRLLDAAIQRYGVDGHIRLLGQRSDIPDLLAASDVFCLPSRSEVMPIALLESMAAGLPPVATNVGGVAELVRDGTDGLITRSGDAPGLAAALLRLQRDAALRSAMSQAGRENVAASYSPEACVSRIEECYRQCRRA